MTRLKSGDIAGLIPGLVTFDAMLEKRTGENLMGIACHGIGIAKEEMAQIISSLTIAVVPFTCGLGIINHFSQTIRKSVEHLGFLSFVTCATDASGIAEAVEKSTDIIMMADDSRYIALHVKQAKIVDNGWATGNAFASALDLMAGGLKGRDVLVTGCGPVGQAAIKTLMGFGAGVAVYDPDIDRCRMFALEILKVYKKELVIETSISRISSRYPYIIEASPAEDIIDTGHITGKTYIAAPGVPSGVTASAVKQLGDRILYDPLQLGTAAMALEAAKG